MSLQIYLPLNGDTKNYGAFNLTPITETNVTVDDDGINGKCYEFSSANSSKLVSTGCTALASKTQWTACCWFYRTATADRQYMVSINGTKASNFVFTLNIYSNHLCVRIAGTDYNTSTSIALNTWYHACMTYDNGKLRIYFNGQFVKEWESTVTPASASGLNIGVRGGDTGYFTGKLNDIRIYDHILKDSEIAWLGSNKKHKKLELWMPLNNQLTSFGTKKITATATAVTYVQGKTGLNATFNGSTSVINTDYVWAPKEGWTIAGWVKHTSATPHGPLVRMSVPTSSAAMDFNGTNGALRCFYYVSSSSANVLTTTYIPAQNTWHHYAATYDGLQMKCYVDGELIQTLSCTGAVYSTTGTVQIGNNTTSGALTGSIADVRLYNYGLTGSEVYELSLGKVGHVMCNCKQLSTAGKDDYNGFGMYRSRCACSAVATTRKQADSPRYQGSFLTNGAYINLSSSFRYTIDACTFSIWAYAASWGAAAWGTGTYASFLSSIEGGGRGMQYLKASGNLTFGDAAVGYAQTVAADLAAGWHLFTWVIDGWQTKLYIDSELISSSTAKTSKTALNNKGNYLLIGYECAGTKTYSNGQFKGKVSNLEIFTKALTANDISKIYAKAHIPPAPST